MSLEQELSLELLPLEELELPLKLGPLLELELVLGLSLGREQSWELLPLELSQELLLGQWLELEKSLEL